MICENWRPDRAGHCIDCGSCILKRDHHCPWINNCVGYHNLKPFFLFGFYETLVGVMYVTIVISYAFFRADPEPDTDDPYALSTFGMCLYYPTNIFLAPMAFSLFGMSLLNFSNMFNGMT